MSGQKEMLSKVISLSNYFTKLEGRRPRLLIASVSNQGNHKINEFSSALADLGFDIDIGAKHISLDQILQQAAENDAHGILLLTDGKPSENMALKFKKYLIDVSCEDMIVVIRTNNDAELSEINLPANMLSYGKEVQAAQIAFNLLKLLLGN